MEAVDSVGQQGCLPVLQVPAAPAAPQDFRQRGQPVLLGKVGTLRGTPCSGLRLLDRAKTLSSPGPLQATSVQPDPSNQSLSAISAPISGDPAPAALAAHLAAGLPLQCRTNTREPTKLLDNRGWRYKYLSPGPHVLDTCQAVGSSIPHPHGPRAPSPRAACRCTHCCWWAGSCCR